MSVHYLHSAEVVHIQQAFLAVQSSAKAMARPVLIKYVDMHVQMQLLSAMVLLRVESRLNSLHS